MSFCDVWVSIESFLCPFEGEFGIFFLEEDGDVQQLCERDYLLSVSVFLVAGLHKFEVTFETERIFLPERFSYCDFFADAFVKVGFERFGGVSEVIVINDDIGEIKQAIKIFAVRQKYPVSELLTFVF
ncbi:hypothetical protein ES703_74185 [subsurface metagenome]